METYCTPKRKFYCFPASNQVEGPFDLVELAGLLRANHITGETLTVAEGEDQWLPFQDRSEFHFAKEIPQDAINRHVQEHAEAQESPFSPRKLMTFFWIMAPFFLYLAYRLLRMYISHHFGHDSVPDAPVDTSGGSQ